MDMFYKTEKYFINLNWSPFSFRENPKYYLILFYLFCTGSFTYSLGEIGGNYYKGTCPEICSGVIYRQCLNQMGVEGF